MNLILRTIPHLLMISRIPSETPNNIRSLTNHSITTQQHRILKCVSLRFVNYADMIETLLRSITNRGIWKFIWLPHISTITLRSNEPLTYDTNFPLSHDSLLIRGFDRRYLCIPSSTSLPISISIRHMDGQIPLLIHVFQPILCEHSMPPLKPPSYGVVFDVIKASFR